MVPTFGFGIEKGADGKHYLMLEVGTGYTRHSFYVGDASNYQANAAVFNKGMLEAGAELARLDSGIVAMNGMSGGDLDAVAASLRGTQRRVKGTTRHAGQERPRSPGR
jgi:phage-related minor tail protein